MTTFKKGGFSSLNQQSKYPFHTNIVSCLFLKSIKTAKIIISSFLKTQLRQPSCQSESHQCPN